MSKSFSRVLFMSCAFAAFPIVEAIADPAQVVLNIVWEVRPGSDYMSTTNTTERDAYTYRGAVAYLPSTNISGTAAFNRLYYAGGSNHMDSTSTSEGSYSFESTLGYGWTSSTAVSGLDGLARVNNGADHATIKIGDSISGYSSQENFGRYGYGRYNNLAEGLNSPFTVGGVTIQSNTVAGGSLWSWKWNNIEFIDHADYGREMQAAIFWYDPITSVLHNPTEAGGKYSYESRPGDRQGSPTLNNQISGNTQITRAIPLEWDPSLFGGSEIHPVIYSGMQLGKDITLNYNSMGAVALYETKIYSDATISSPAIEIPTGYMPSSFNRFYTYDASSQTLTEVYPGSCNNTPVNYTPSSGYGGVIISNSSQTAAMAVYGRGDTVGGPVHVFALFNFISCSATSKWNAAAYPSSLSSGWTTFRTYVTSGTLTNVVANLRQLYVDGAL